MKQQTRLKAWTSRLYFVFENASFGFSFFWVLLFVSFLFLFQISRLKFLICINGSYLKLAEQFHLYTILILEKIYRYTRIQALSMHACTQTHTHTCPHTHKHPKTHTCAHKNTNNKNLSNFTQLFFFGWHLDNLSAVALNI